MALLPTDTPSLTPTGLGGTATPAHHAQWHNDIALAFPELGLPVVTTASAGHLDIHARIQLALWLWGVADSPTENLAGHGPGAHLPIHEFANIRLRTYGPKAGYTQPAGSTVIAEGADIQAALTAGSTGQKFWLASATVPYRITTSLVAKTNQELHGPAGAKISGAKVLSGWTADGADWWVGGQTQRFTQTAGYDPLVLAGFINHNKPEDLWFDGEWFEQVTNRADLASGKFWFDYTNSRIYLRDDPAGHVVETTACEKAFTGAATGVKLYNLIIERFGTPLQDGAIEVSGPTVVDCEVAWCHGGGINFVGGFTTVQGCKVHHSGQNAIRGTANGLVETTEIAYNNVCGVDPYFEAVTKWAFTTDVTVRRCWVHHNRGRGLWTDIDNDGTDYNWNLCEDNDLGGIFHEISLSALMERNICRRNGQAPYSFWAWDRGGIEYHDIDGMVARFNSCYDNGGGSILGYVDTRVTAHDHTNNDVHENRLHVHAGYAGLNHDGGVSSPSQYYLTKNNRYRLNEYIQPAGNQFHWWNGTAVAAIPFSTWQAQNQDTAGSLTVATPPFDRPTGFTDSFDGLNQQPWDARFWRRTGTANTQHDRHRGRITPGAGAFARQHATARTKPAADAQVLAKLRRDDAANQGAVDLWLRASPQLGAAPTDGYLLQLACSGGGPDDIYYNRVSGGATTFITTITTGLVHGTAYWIRWQIIGDAHKVRVWADGTSEPGTWTAEFTNSVITAAGRLIVQAENGSGGTAVVGLVDSVTYALL